MSVYIHKNNQQSGPFEDGSVLEWMRNGQLSPNDLACRTGANSWLPLKVLYPSAPAAAAAVAAFTAPGSGAGFVNGHIAGWARQMFPAPVRIRLRLNSFIMQIFGFGLLLFFPLLFAAFTFYGLITGGIQASMSGLVITTITLGFAALIFFLIRFTRSKITKILDADGAETLYGKRYRWENLQYIKYQKVNPRGLVQQMLFAGAKRVNTELIFTGGKTVIAPLSINQAEILKLLETIPAPRQGEEYLR